VSLGLDYRTFHLLTVGEIQDLAVCRAIAHGSMEEKPVFKGKFLPKLR